MAEKVVAVTLTARAGQYITQMGAAAKATGAVGTAAGRAAVAAQPMDRSLRNAARATDILNPKLIGAAGLVYGLKSVVGQTMRFEDEFAQVRKTMEGTREELDGVALDMRELAESMPVTTTELNAIATVAGQLGVQSGEVVDFTETVAQLSVTTNMTAEQAAIDFARLSNILGTPISEIDVLGNLAVRLGNNMAAQETEIMEFAKRIGGVGTQMGMTVDEIMALSAALPALGLRPEMGGTAITRIMVEMQAAVTEAGEKLDIFAETAGMSASEFSEAWRSDPAETLLTFTAGVGNLSDSGADAFETVAGLDLSMIRTQDTLLRLAGGTDVYREAQELANDEMEKQSANQIEWDKRLETTRAQLDIFKGKVREAAIEIGGPLNDAFGALLETMNTQMDENGFWKTILGVPDPSIYMGDGSILGSGGFFDDIFQRDVGEMLSTWFTGDYFGEYYGQQSGSPGGGGNQDVDSHLAAMGAQADQYVSGLLDAAAANDAAAGSTERFVGELQQAQRQMSDNERSVEMLAGAFDLLIRGNLRAEDAELNRIAAFNDLNEALEESTKVYDENGKVIATVAATLDASTEAGFRNRQEINGTANAILGEVEARHEQGRSLGEATALYDEQVRALKDTMIQYGLTEDEAQEYIETLGLTPEKIITELAANSDDADAAILEYIELTGRIPRDISTNLWFRVHARQLNDALARAGATGQDQAIHTGGYIHPSGTLQRFHSGGMVGLKSDEVPAILQTGEMVLSRHQVGQLGAAFSNARETMRPAGGDGASSPLWGIVNFYAQDVSEAVDKAHHRMRMQQWQGVYG